MGGGCAGGRARLRDAAYLAFNFWSAVGIVFINKLVFTRVTFTFPSLLTLLHYGVTWAGASLLQRMRTRAVSPTREPQRHRPLARRDWILAVVVGWAPAVNNLALSLNPVGFYQVVKLGVTPAIVAVEWRCFSKRVSPARACCLVAVTVGVAAATVGGSADTSWSGLAASAVWLPIAATYKVLWSAVTREEGWDTLDLMVRTIPPAMLFQLPLMLVTDSLRSLPDFDWTSEACALLLLSGIGAFAVNLSGFLVMGELSALTHVVIGQAKACLTMLGGYLFWREAYPPLKLLGAVTAICAMALYTHFNLMEHAQRQRRESFSDGEHSPSGSGDDGPPCGAPRLRSPNTRKPPAQGPPSGAASPLSSPHPEAAGALAR
eukprot:TRINITY_DN65406_c0_g1_i1.p1 TRINITY_DN65406_c0_g1~~TRINITY_DN65406_c0_g1_i1.p1  ORF type:complete len:376 (+),score=84.55 TRINITY_DN65406_c0_g1_i1:111-1238(+)